MERIETLLAPLRATPWLETTVFLAGLIVLAVLADMLTKRVLLRVVGRVVKATHNQYDDALLERGVIARLANVVPAVVIFLGIPYVPGIHEGVVVVVRNVANGYVILTIALALGNLLSGIGDIYERRNPDRARTRPIKGYLQLVKIVLFIVATILVIAVLVDRSPLLLLSGLGAMTAVLMLVFQDTILSLVASAQVSSDGRVRIGDWIEMPAQNADGDVIDIALHTITVRNWDKTVTRVPTKYLISESFKNWRGMTETGARRIRRSLYIDQRSVRFLEPDEVEHFHRFALLDEYLDGKEKELREWNAKLAEHGREPVNQRRVTNLGTFRAYVNQYLANHAGLHHGMTTLVRQMDPTEHGLPLQLWCFTSDVRWKPYEDVQSDIFDHLLAILPEFDLRVFQASSDAPLDVNLHDRRPGGGDRRTDRDGERDARGTASD